ncbi:MAG TPA: glycosyltransferase family 39 protein, partial [Flavisolibacter sp.]
MAEQGKFSVALILFVVSLGLLMVNLGKPMIYILDEAKNAECAREMLVSGDYIVPEFNGQLRTDKPPLHYFFMIAAYKMFGVSAFSARFFSAVFGALTILVVYLFTRSYAGKRAALFGAVVLMASLHFNFQMRLAVPDPYLIFWMTSSFMTFFLFLTKQKKIWLWLMYISIGLGLLTKGPIALGLPGLIMLVFLLLTGKFNWRTIRSFYIPAGILIVLAIALPWYWLNYEVTNGEWTDRFFFKHNLGRYSDTMEGHGGFFLLPLLMVIVGLLPLGVFGISSATLAMKRRSNEFQLFSLLIVGGIVVFFSFSQTKLPNYTAPAYPFAAILIGYFFDRLIKGEIRSSVVKWAYGFYTFVAFAIPAGVYFGLKADKLMYA